jgi:hypothetical protein
MAVRRSSGALSSFESPFVYLPLALLEWLLAGTDCRDGAAFRQKHRETGLD